MPAYLIADVDVHDPKGYEEYRRLVGPSLQKYGARFLARGGRIEVLEGTWAPTRVVIVEFENAEKARRWYQSEEYRPAKEARQRASTANFILVEGV
ncbi:MAG TPA: DUF1330 domain-containing protein [Burkholderiales bacterium]|nr:DUF1330 domain-containing protein [Burkholderiales bacterium]